MSAIIINPYALAGAPSSSFPVIESTATHAQTSDSSSWASLTMPSGIVAGDILIAIMACDSAVVTVSFDSTAATGWTRPRYASNGVTTSFAYKEADGSGTDDLTITLGSAQQGGVAIFRISGAEPVATQAPESAGQNYANTATPDPSSLTPTGGAKDYLWIAYAGMDQGADLTSGPSGYDTGVQIKGGSGGGSTSISYAVRELNAASEDPGVFTFASANDSWAGLVCVHPA